jgi:phage terminase large subunit
MENIVITPTDKQKEAYRSCDRNRIVLYGGSVRGGKSYFLCLYAFTVAYKYPNSRWLFLRESLPTLKRTLLVTFNNLLEQGFRQYVKEFNEQSLTVTLTNGSQFIFMAESFDTDKELNRFRGLEINGAFIDE